MKFNKDIVIGKYLSGNSSAEEQRQLQQWLNEDPRNRRELEASEKMWTVSLTLKKETSGNAVRAWEEFKTLTKAAPKVKKLYLRPLAIAAGFALIISTVLLVKFFMNDVNSESDSMLVKQHIQVLSLEPMAVASQGDNTMTPSSARKKNQKAKPSPAQMAINIVHTGDSAGIYILPDGSTVYMNKGSHMRFSENGRNILLDGEAYFEVTPDTLPFYVTCKSTVTKALGTSLNVKGYSDTKTVEVMVIDGRAEVYNQPLVAKTELLKAGEQATYTEGQAFVKSKAQKKDKWWSKNSLKNRIKQFFKKLKNKLN
jgi:ferric-dicitrate binding protein FerR (iron transport regulator)